MYSVVTQVSTVEYFLVLMRVSSLRPVLKLRHSMNFCKHPFEDINIIFTSFSQSIIILKSTWPIVSPKSMAPKWIRSTAPSSTKSAPAATATAANVFITNPSAKLSAYNTCKKTMQSKPPSSTAIMWAVQTLRLPWRSNYDMMKILELRRINIQGNDEVPGNLGHDPHYGQRLRQVERIVVL